jgi:hypothetical protein
VHKQTKPNKNVGRSFLERHWEDFIEKAFLRLSLLTLQQETRRSLAQTAQQRYDAGTAVLVKRKPVLSLN